MNTPLKFLIIRRDNIGDLLCVTPSIHALRKKYPDAYISVLCNTYNAPILKNNLDIDKIESYKKGKHRGGESLLSVYFHKVKLIFSLRKKQFDYIVVASSAEKKRDWNLAQWIRPASIVGYIHEDVIPKKNDLTIKAPPCSEEKGRHEVEYVFKLFELLGVHSPIPTMQLHAESPSYAIGENPSDLKSKIIGIQISARKVRQQWPIENFSDLIEKINNKFNVNFLIFWSPGDTDNPTHPGDDDKANKLLELCHQLPVKLYPTDSLSDLTQGLSLCDSVICSDGGGMHIAAALGKPIVCLFGNSNAKQWHPWGVPYGLLQPASENVSDISVDAVFLAFKNLYK